MEGRARCQVSLTLRQSLKILTKAPLSQLRERLASEASAASPALSGGWAAAVNGVGAQECGGGGKTRGLQGAGWASPAGHVSQPGR